MVYDRDCGVLEHSLKCILTSRPTPTNLLCVCIVHVIVCGLVWRICWKSGSTKTLLDIYAWLCLIYCLIYIYADSKTLILSSTYTHISMLMVCEYVTYQIVAHFEVTTRIANRPRISMEWFAVSNMKIIANAEQHPNISKEPSGTVHCSLSRRFLLLIMVDFIYRFENKLCSFKTNNRQNRWLVTCVLKLRLYNIKQSTCTYYYCSFDVHIFYECWSQFRHPIGYNYKEKRKCT